MARRDTSEEHTLDSDAPVTESHDSEETHTHDHGHSHDHDHSHGHGHGHGHAHHGMSTSSWKLGAVALLNFIGFIAEFIGGLVFGSVALLSDAIHMLFDTLSYVVAFAASFVADQYDGNPSWTYGFHRLEPLAAFLNGMFLVPLVVFIVWTAYQRFLNPVEIATGPTIAIAFFGLAINVISIVVLHSDEMSLNEKGAFYHLLGDTAGSVLVIVSVTVIAATGVTAIDPVAAVLIAVVVLWSAGRVIRGSGEIFFLKAPFEDGDVVRRAVEDVEGVSCVVDWHAWQICSQITVVTAHVETSVETVVEVDDLTQQIHTVLHEHGVDHATVEVSPSYTDREAYLNAHDH